MRPPLYISSCCAQALDDMTSPDGGQTDAAPIGLCRGCHCLAGGEPNPDHADYPRFLDPDRRKVARA